MEDEIEKDPNIEPKMEKESKTNVNDNLDNTRRVATTPHNDSIIEKFSKLSLSVKIWIVLAVLSFLVYIVLTILGVTPGGFHYEYNTDF